MAQVTFTHPRLALTPLEISVNPDQVTWAYGLNTMSYPTYGGEVVQILSVYFDDMTLTGTVSTYAEMEVIYGWFIAYMQYATQGRDNPSYDQHPVTFSYPERAWQFNIWPKALPGFRYGRDVVAPTWSLVAAVSETSDSDTTLSLTDLVKQAAIADTAKGDVALFGKATGDFGTTGNLQKNPWASPDADPTRAKGETVTAWAAKVAQQEGDHFSQFLSSYEADNTLTIPNLSKVLISQPAKHSGAPSSGADGPTQKKGAKTKK